MLTLLRTNEYVYRIGGDEFCILVPEFRDKKELKVIAQRLIKEISEIKYLDSIKINIGCSIGISIFSDYKNLSDLMSSADGAMYLSKESGKNIFNFSKE